MIEGFLYLEVCNREVQLYYSLKNIDYFYNYYSHSTVDNLDHNWNLDLLFLTCYYAIF